MFEFVRTHTKLLQLLLLVLILPSFVVFGIQGYTSFNEGAQGTVAKVDGQSISQAEWDNAHRLRTEQLRQQMPDLDAKLLDSPAARTEVLEGLVRERVMLSAAQRAHLSVSPERIAREVQAMPELARLRRPDGSFDVAGYKALLEAQGNSPAAFEARVAQDLRLRQVLQPLAQSAVAPKAVVDSALEALWQRRELRLQRFELQAYQGRVSPTDAEIEAYYKAHEAEFRAPEQASIDYVVLDMETIKKSVPVGAEDLRKYYDENASRYTTAEERRARHILIQAPKEAPADQRQKAKARAEALLAEARKQPDAFAELAKKNSDDPGSANVGGDLDFFVRDSLASKALSDAAFSMKPGEIGNLVESEFGYHVVKLEAIRGGQKKPFEEVRSTIEDEVRKQLAQKRWAAAAEEFSNGVYEQYESLQPVIDKLKLEKKSATVQRQPVPGATGPLASPKLLEAVFANDSVQNKRNTAAVEVGPQQLVSARVTQHQPARTLPLAEVRDRVRMAVVAEQAAALARKDGEALLAQLRKDGQGELPIAATVSRIKPEGLPRDVLEAVLRADAGKLPAYVGTELKGMGYFVARIDKVLPKDVPEVDPARLQSQYAQVWANAEAQAYYQALRKRFKVEQKGAALAAAAAAASAASR